MAPTLFNMMFSAILMDAFQDCNTGFPIRYRFADGKLHYENLPMQYTEIFEDVKIENFQ